MTDSFSLALCGAPLIQRQERVLSICKAYHTGTHKGPTGIIKACTQWFITCSARGLGTKTSETELCDGWSSNLPITLRKWSAFKCLAAAEIRFSLDKGTFYDILGSFDNTEKRIQTKAGLRSHGDWRSQRARKSSEHHSEDLTIKKKVQFIRGLIICFEWTALRWLVSFELQRKTRASKIQTDLHFNSKWFG